MDSILTSVKKMLGISEEYTHFDPDIIIHINSVFTILTQLGVGPVSGFSISDKSTDWHDFIDNNNELEAVKSYVYLKVRLLFDPPSSSAALDAMSRTISELEWRLMVIADSVTTVNETDGDTNEASSD